jgi:hypothetical protein
MITVPHIYRRRANVFKVEQCIIITYLTKTMSKQNKHLLFFLFISITFSRKALSFWQNPALVYLHIIFIIVQLSVITGFPSSGYSHSNISTESQIRNCFHLLLRISQYTNIHVKLFLWKLFIFVFPKYSRHAKVRRD